MGWTENQREALSENHPCSSVRNLTLEHYFITHRMASKFIDNMRGVLDRDAADMRKPGAKKVHTRGLWSAGPNEEWCVDGHEKILLCMGIAVWGIIDKYAREELNLWAVPDARTADVPPALYLLMVRAKKGNFFYYKFGKSSLLTPRGFGPVKPG
jgi:transposase InsO family protein